MKILLLGHNGQVGREVNNLLDCFTFERNILNLNDFSNLGYLTDQIKFDVIVNCAAYTNVEEAEVNKSECLQVNAHALKELSLLAVKRNIPLIHLSTDYVFDGKKKKPYDETDEASPINFYGKSKLKGEENIIASGCNYAVIRTSWVFSEHGKNFVNTLRNIAKNRKDVKIVSDQFGGPTPAKAIAEIIEKLIKNRLIFSENFKEIFHFSGKPGVSWFQFAKFINNYFNLTLDISETTSDAFKTKARRPKYSILKCTKINSMLNYHPILWEKYLQEFKK